eukprot:5870236-Heterocapsa_arctica.AAC.1
MAAPCRPPHFPLHAPCDGVLGDLSQTKHCSDPACSPAVRARAQGACARGTCSTHRTAHDRSLPHPSPLLHHDAAGPG